MPRKTPLAAELARVAATRWSIEECLERAKGEVVTSPVRGQALGGRAPARHPVPVAHAFLEVTRTRANDEEEKGGKEELIPLTAPEVHRLLLALALPVEEHGFRLPWSEW